MSKEQKYEEAFAELQDIVRKMENDEYSIDEIAVQLKTAQRLIKFCKDKLTKTEAEISKIQADLLGISIQLVVTLLSIIVDATIEIPVQLSTQ